MNLQILGTKENVVRYVGLLGIGNKGKVKSHAFTKDIVDPAKRGVSVCWLEYFADQTKSGQLDSIRNLIKYRLKLGAQAKLAELNVGRTIDNLKRGIDEYNSNADNEPITCDFCFQRTPLCAENGMPANPSHCDIVFWPIPNAAQANAIGAMLAMSISQLHPAKPE